MHYCKNVDSKFDLTELTKECRKDFLVFLIMTEHPDLIYNIKIENPNKEMQTLMELCKFFNSVLKEEEIIYPSDWDLEFENKHHSLVALYLKTRACLSSPTPPKLL